MSPWTSFWNGRRSIRRITLKFHIANGRSFVPLLEKNSTRPVQVNAIWRHKQNNLRNCLPWMNSLCAVLPLTELQTLCVVWVRKWPHLNLHFFNVLGNHLWSLSLADRYLPRPTNLHFMWFHNVLHSDLLFSFSIVPLDCLRGKSGTCWPSLPNGSVTMRGMPFSFALCVIFFKSRYLNNQGFGGMAMLLWF